MSTDLNNTELSVSVHNARLIYQQKFDKEVHYVFLWLKKRVLEYFKEHEAVCPVVIRFESYVRDRFDFGYHEEVGVSDQVREAAVARLNQELSTENGWSGRYQYKYYKATWFNHPKCVLEG